MIFVCAYIYVQREIKYIQKNKILKVCANNFFLKREKKQIEKIFYKRS